MMTEPRADELVKLLMDRQTEGGGGEVPELCPMKSVEKHRKLTYLEKGYMGNVCLVVLLSMLDILANLSYIHEYIDSFINHPPPF